MNTAAGWASPYPCHRIHHDRDSTVRAIWATVARRQSEIAFCVAHLHAGRTLPSDKNCHVRSRRLLRLSLHARVRAGNEVTVMRIRSGKTALQMRPLPHAVLLSLALLAPTANAQVVPFVDYYKTNVTANTTPATNAAVTLLSGYSQLWTTATWDTGAPTSMGELVMSPSQAYSVKITTERSAAESESAYLI